MRPIVKEKANFDIDEEDLMIDKAIIDIPGIFIASKYDALVPFQQIDQLFKKYKGDK